MPGQIWVLLETSFENLSLFGLILSFSSVTLTFHLLCIGETWDINLTTTKATTQRLKPLAFLLQVSIHEFFFRHIFNQLGKIVFDVLGVHLQVLLYDRYTILMLFIHASITLEHLLGLPLAKNKIFFLLMRVDSLLGLTTKEIFSRCSGRQYLASGIGPSPLLPIKPPRADRSRLYGWNKLVSPFFGLIFCGLNCGS